ncbi:hypothetical protein O1Q96_29185 [Streptomyces sp. Qhu-G9]|uniref:hypothetical protein n=1 Tax=Streptomyces sp. Qhu-G9 TaxID=3452799 RepID=UPI0022ABD167|nr:hypothetical protein [Streptomyces aurantiacus]WAU83405.1 hypothetical protein O1Q96_29185 [Streptomyces aurantiacus]
MSDELDPLRESAAPTVTEHVPDLQLQMLVRLVAQDPEAALPITLVIGGGLLYGDLISHKAWTTDWARSLHGVDGAGAQLLERFPEQVDQAVVDKQGRRVPERLPQWVHLRDATSVVGAGGPVLMPLWRGRLADISGWSLGKPDSSLGDTTDNGL